MQREFWKAVYDGREDEVKKILTENKEINVNLKEVSTGWTALNYACFSGYDKIVTILMAHPDIDVNVKTDVGRTPFCRTCVNGKTSCARLLLKDARVKVNEPDNNGRTPLWHAAYDGYLEIIKWWIASGREMNMEPPRDSSIGVIEIAKFYEHLEVVSLLEKVEANPTQTRREVRVELECFDELAAELFAVVIFLSDGLLELGEKNTNGAAVFFKITRNLPMELQMVLCYRVVGSMKMNIPGEQRERAFKKLVKDLN